MFVENTLRHSLQVQDITTPEEEIRLSAMTCEGMNQFAIIQKEQIEEGHVIADIDPRNWFKVVNNDPNNIKESLVGVLVTSKVDRNSDNWEIMSILTNHPLCPELVKDAAGP